MYKSFKERNWYYGSMHDTYGTVRPGSLVLYAITSVDGYESLELIKILGLVDRGADGLEYKNTKKDPVFYALRIDSALRFGFGVHVRKSAIRRTVEPNAFMRWFLFGQTPDAKVVRAMESYGALSGSYIEKYLTGPEGDLQIPDTMGAKK